MTANHDRHGARPRSLGPTTEQIATAGEPGRFTVGLTGDAVRSDGSSIHGELGPSRLTEAGVTWSVLPDPHAPEFLDALGQVDAVLSFGHRAFGAREAAACPRLKLVARFGAGYETVDLDACTAAGIAVTNTPEAVRRPLALAGLTMLLAVSHHLLAKDRITRTGRWDEREHYRGVGIEGKTLGILGFGGVGGELASLARPLGLEILGHNRSGHSEVAERLGVPLVGREELADRSDFLVLAAGLNPDSRHVVDAALLARMRSSSFLINIGRGGLVDQPALVAALRERRIAGAALDVFEQEPLDPADPLLTLDNVLLSPHALCWTEDFTDRVTASAYRSITDIAAGRAPHNLLNPDVWDSPLLRARPSAAQRP